MILTTHYMEEAERLCDRVAIVDHGLLLDCDSPLALVKKHIGAEVVEISSGAETGYWKSKLGQLKIQFQDHDTKLFAFFSDAHSRQQFVSQLQNIHYVTRLANLNDVFLRLAGYQMRGES